MSGLRKIGASCELVELCCKDIAELVLLEKRCYPNPWTEELIAAEFEKSVSFRPAYKYRGRIVSYSFNHLVGDELHILGIAVDPDYRRLGLGSKLLEHVLSESARRGAHFATLEVRRENQAAQDLYQKFGFHRIGIRKKYYCDNGEDAFVLIKELRARKSAQV